MQSKATTVDQYIDELPEVRKQAMAELRKVIKKNNTKGFQETMGYGNADYVVPHSKYPAGYHCDPTLLLPLWDLLRRKILLPSITWEYMLIQAVKMVH